MRKFQFIINFNFKLILCLCLIAEWNNQITKINAALLKTKLMQNENVVDVEDKEHASSEISMEMETAEGESEKVL